MLATVYFLYNTVTYRLLLGLRYSYPKSGSVIRPLIQLDLDCVRPRPAQHDTSLHKTTPWPARLD